MHAEEHMKIALMLFCVTVSFLYAPALMAEEPQLQDYTVVVVKDFTVDPTTPAPDSSGPQFSDTLVFQLRRYNVKFKLFTMVIMEGTHEIEEKEKVLIIGGEITGYSPPSARRRQWQPFAEYTGTAGFAVHCKFIDGESEEVIYETDIQARSGSIDTIERAMLRAAAGVAKISYHLKMGEELDTETE